MMEEEKTLKITRVFQPLRYFNWKNKVKLKSEEDDIGFQLPLKTRSL